MKIFSTHVIKFVVIATSLGEFRVSSNGNVEVWKDDAMDYLLVYDWDYEEGAVKQLREIATKELT